jgi:hypothetical protein
MKTLEAKSSVDAPASTPLESVGGELNTSPDDRLYQAEQLAMDIQEALQRRDPDLDFEAIVTSEDMDLVALLAANRSTEIASTMEDTQEKESLLFRLSEKLNSTKATKFITKLGTAAIGGVVGIASNRFLASDSSLVQTALTAFGSAIALKSINLLPEVSNTLDKDALSSEEVKSGVTEWVIKGIKQAEEANNPGSSDISDESVEASEIGDMDSEAMEVAELSESLYKDMNLAEYIKLVASFLIDKHSAEISADRGELADDIGGAVVGSALGLFDLGKLSGGDTMKPVVEMLKTVRGKAAEALGRVAVKLLKPRRIQ